MSDAEVVMTNKLQDTTRPSQPWYMYPSTQPPIPYIHHGETVEEAWEQARQPAALAIYSNLDPRYVAMAQLYGIYAPGIWDVTHDESVFLHALDWVLMQLGWTTEERRTARGHGADIRAMMQTKDAGQNHE